MTTDRVARLEMEKKALFQRIARLRKRVNQLEEFLEDYLEFSETGQFCSVRCDESNNHCNTCVIVYFENSVKKLLGKETD